MTSHIGSDRRTLITTTAVGLTGLVLPTRASAASGPSGLGGPEETTTTTTTVPAPTAAYEPSLDFAGSFNPGTGTRGVDVYMGWGQTYSTFSFGGAAGKVSGVTSADKSDFDYVITYTPNALPEQETSATGSSSNGYTSRSLLNLKLGSVVTVTVTSKTTSGSTNPAGVVRSATYTVPS